MSVFFVDFVFSGAWKGAVSLVVPQGIVVRRGLCLCIDSVGVFIGILADPAALDIFELLGKGQFFRVDALFIIDIAG